ncbi:redoxin domain-containing protein [Paenibacillus faecalis]|uniref:redoxin domain-containing protein n=1 Tax=Paenibacillus faecalis TaxID=2079532 RepID=UPI000D11167C|nr:redoxin domain-containing protein [Paenibacillus faecalis]
MVKYRKTIQITILLAIVVLGAYAITTVVMGNDSVPKVGDKAPDFQLLGLDGEVHTLKNYDGKSKVINFWGTYCPPCVREMPALQAQWEKWRSKGVEVIGVNVGEDKMIVEDFVKQTGVEFPILMDPERDAVSDYKVSAMPATYFVSAKGEIVNITIGELDLSTLDKQIEQLVNMK